MRTSENGLARAMAGAAPRLSQGTIWLRKPTSTTAAALVRPQRVHHARGIREKVHPHDHAEQRVEGAQRPAVKLLDGALQFQPFMYSKGFIQMLTGTAAGQPHWLASSINWAAELAQGNLTVFNTLFALTQVAIGLGLLYRRTVKPALVLSLVWALGVWWFSEGFGMIFAGANPLTGAPGAVLLYAIIGLFLWPGARPAGLLGLRGARITWCALWLVMAWAWLLAPNSSANATSSAIMSAPGAGFLHSLQSSAASVASGHGLVIAIVLALVSAAIGAAVAKNWRPAPFIALAIVLNLGYWVIGQGFGGVFYTNSATDPNAGPLFVLLALVLYSLTRSDAAVSQAADIAAGHGRAHSADTLQPAHRRRQPVDATGGSGR